MGAKWWANEQNMDDQFPYTYGLSKWVFENRWVWLVRTNHTRTAILYDLYLPTFEWLNFHVFFPDIIPSSHRFTVMGTKPAVPFEIEITWIGSLGSPLPSEQWTHQDDLNLPFLGSGIPTSQLLWVNLYWLWGLHLSQCDKTIQNSPVHGSPKKNTLWIL